MRHQSGEEPDVNYTLPAAGSRSNWDDVQVKWESSRPVSTKSVNRTDFPIFCRDLTPRSVRVPFDDDEKTTHPCGAVGISTVEVIVPKPRCDNCAELYPHIVGASPRSIDERGKATRLDFEIGLPVQGLGSSIISL